MFGNRMSPCCTHLLASTSAAAVRAESRDEPRREAQDAAYSMFIGHIGPGLPKVYKDFARYLRPIATMALG